MRGRRSVPVFNSVHLQVVIVKAQLQLCSVTLVAMSALMRKENKMRAEKEIRHATESEN